MPDRDPSPFKYEFKAFVLWFVGLVLPPAVLYGAQVAEISSQINREWPSYFWSDRIGGFLGLNVMQWFWVQGVLLLLCVLEVRRWSGSREVERALWRRGALGQWVVGIPCFLIPALFFTPGVVAIWLLFAAYVFVHSIQLVVWSIRAATSVERPKHLTSVDPPLMLFSAFLLAGAVSASVCLVLLGSQFRDPARGYRPAWVAFSKLMPTELMLINILSESGESDFSSFFRDPANGGSLTFENLAAAEAFYTKAFNDLLAKGRNATLPELNPDILKKLDTFYFPQGNDSWGQPYRFFAGPLKDTGNRLRLPDGTIREYPLPFRAYGAGTPMTAVSAPAILPIYVDNLCTNVYTYSTGYDQISGQALDTEQVSVDDIGSWDITGNWRTESWRNHYPYRDPSPFKLRWRSHLSFSEDEAKP
jgi:hypothetical protein